MNNETYGGVLDFQGKDGKPRLIKNAVIEGGGGGGTTVTVDSELSLSSENPVQNKVITGALNALSSEIGTIETTLHTLNSGTGATE